MADTSPRKILPLKRRTKRNGEDSTETIAHSAPSRAERQESDVPADILPMFPFEKDPAGPEIKPRALAVKFVEKVDEDPPETEPQATQQVIPNDTAQALTSHVSADAKAFPQFGRDAGNQLEKKAPFESFREEHSPNQARNTSNCSSDVHSGSPYQDESTSASALQVTSQVRSPLDERAANSTLESFGECPQTKSDENTDQAEPPLIDPFADLISSTKGLRLGDPIPPQAEASLGDTSVANIKAEADTDAWQKRTYLHSCREGNLSLVKAIFSVHGSEIAEYVDLDGNNGTLLAAQNFSSIETMRFLCQQGVSPDHANRVGRTALMEAVLWGHLELVEYLVLHMQPDDFEARDGTGSRAIDIAADPYARPTSLERNERRKSVEKDFSRSTDQDRRKIMSILSGYSFASTSYKDRTWQASAHASATVDPSSGSPIRAQPHAQTGRSMAQTLPPAPYFGQHSPIVPTRHLPQRHFYPQPTAYPTNLLPLDILYTYPTGEVDHYVLRKTLIPPKGGSYKAFAVLYRGPSYDHVYAMSGYSQPDHLHVIDNTMWSQKGLELMCSLGMSYSDVPGAHSHVEPQLLAFILDQHTVQSSDGRRMFPPHDKLEARIAINKADFCVSCRELACRFEQAYPEANVTYRFMDPHAR